MKRTFSFVLAMSLCLTIAKAQPDAGKLVFNHTFAPSEGLLNRYEKGQRQELCLNGYWDFMPVALPDDYKHGKGHAPQLVLPDENASWSGQRIKIPSPWNVNSFAYRNLEGPDHRNYPSYPEAWNQVKMAWMRKLVSIPSDWKGRQIKLHFEAVAGCTEVYVNRKKAGTNFDLFLPFDVDITSEVAPGSTVEVLVGVRSQSLFEDNSTVGRRIVPAGSMWGYTVNGIWQDVYLVALPKIYVEDVYIKPQVDEKALVLEVTLSNNTERKATLNITGDVFEWINRTGTDVLSAPIPAWELGQKTLRIPETKVVTSARSQKKVSIRVPVSDGALRYWSPEHTDLYALLLTIKDGKQTLDTKYERFGWRQWSISGNSYMLNGNPIQLHGDSWHFMGIPQMTRRYAWAWFTAIKGMNGNAVRPHAQVYPRFYLDMADEMGICVLNETANWASDGGPKLDSDAFWAASKEHLRRFVLRDRNHASVFGWSVSNENKPVILHVYNRPDLIPAQAEAWRQWRDIVKECDPTRPWISADGEDDGNGTLPVTVGHYGDMGSMRHWASIGKPWGVGEHSMAYYGTPEQVSKYNGERAYASQIGRMEGLANEAYNLIADQRRMGATYTTVFNMVWYALKPLPLGKRNTATAPDESTDGVFFNEYKEGVPGVQPERIGPYSTTLNPGYDPSLPLYSEWPMYSAMRAANAADGPAWSPYATAPNVSASTDEVFTPEKHYKTVLFIGDESGKLKAALDMQGVCFSRRKTHDVSHLIYIIDGSRALSAEDVKTVKSATLRGADVLIIGPTPETLPTFLPILPYGLELVPLKRSSFIPAHKSWVSGLENSDFYFCEQQKADASSYSLSGPFVDNGEVLLNACRTDWRRWNKQPEEIKTAGTLRSENECPPQTAALAVCRNGTACFYVSTLTEFANSEKGFRTLASMLRNAGIPCTEHQTDAATIFFVRDGQLSLPHSVCNQMTADGEQLHLRLYVYSPRPLDDLLIEPDMPKLSLNVKAKTRNLTVNGKAHAAVSKDERQEVTYRELPLQQGWNTVDLTIGKGDLNDFEAAFICRNKEDFLPQLRVSLTNPEVK